MKTQALKTKSWDKKMIVNRVVIRELKRLITAQLRTTLILENQIELIYYDCQNEKDAEMTSNAMKIKAINYGLLRFEQVFKKMQDHAILIRSDNTTAVYDIGKWKAKESLKETIKHVFFLMKRNQLQITIIHILGKLNTSTDSFSKLCRSGDYTLKDGIVTKEIEIRQSTRSDNCTDLAGKIVVHQTKEFIHQIPLPWIIRENSGDGTEDVRFGSKVSTQQCGRLLSGLVADMRRDLLMRSINMRGFSEERVNVIFNNQRFNTVQRDFYSPALLQDRFEIERKIIEDMIKKDADVIQSEVVAFYTR
ncbi:MAG: hypothetical protein EZS28_045466, partial [Streblomastix strix]